jgi:integrase
MTNPRRRQAGEGGISEYVTKAGPRYLIKYGYIREDGSRAVALKRGYPTRKAAGEALREQLGNLDRGTFVAPNKVTVGEHMATWLDGLRVEPSTVASYRKNVRLHVTPHVGALRLEQLTGTRLTKLYHQLEQTGRTDGKGGLSARTVRYIHTIIHAGLRAAVRDGLLSVNPADKANPPSAKAAKAPEMHPWTVEELRAFLGQRAEAADPLLIAWSLLVSTGMRRGEALGLRWADVDFDGSRLSVRRSVSVIKREGAGKVIVVGTPKSGKARTIDLDSATLATLKAHKAARGTLALALARDDAYVLGNLDGSAWHAERFSRRFGVANDTARKALGEDKLSKIRLHDLRHTHATLMLQAGEAVKVVSERLGHASVMITLGTYAHVMPGMQAGAAARFGALLSGESGSKYQGGITGGVLGE